MRLALWFGNRPDTTDAFDGDSSRRDAARRARDTLEPAHALDATSNALVARIRQGDVAAFNEVYLTYFERLWRLAYRYLRSRDAAADLVQDIFADVWMRHATWDPHGSFDAYLFRAVRNRVVSLHRHTAVRDALPATTGDEVPALGSLGEAADEHVTQADVLARIRHAIDRLTERQRAATLLRWEHDVSYVDIGLILGISEAAVRKLLAHARERLRPLLDELGTP